MPLPDGSTHNVTPKELLNLAQYGMTELQKAREAKQAPEPEELDVEGKVSKLERELQELRDERKNETELNQINSTLAAANAKNSILKDEPKLSAIVNAVALSQYNNNPRISLDQWHDQAAKLINEIITSRVEKEKEKLNANNKVRSLVNATNRSGTGATLDGAKKYKGSDIQDGTSKRALMGFLSQLEK